MIVHHLDISVNMWVEVTASDTSTSVELIVGVSEKTYIVLFRSAGFQRFDQRNVIVVVAVVLLEGRGVGGQVPVGLVNEIVSKCAFPYTCSTLCVDVVGVESYGADREPQHITL